MKHKISRRLIGYFSAVLLLFSLVVGGLFFLLFTLHTAELQAQDLRLHAASIADTVSQFLQNYCEGSCNGGGFRAYLRFVGDFAMSDLWLVDKAGRTVELGQSAGSAPAAPLEPDIAELARAVLSEGSVASASSSLFFDSTLTVGAPVKGADDVAAYALLLRRKIDAVGRAQQDGLVILAFCLLTALVLASALSVLLARRFVTPLKRMARATEQIMDGDYAARTEVSQSDEIGALARHIDELSARLCTAESERKEMEQMRQDFLSTISHELRTPVTVIKGSLEVLNEGLVTSAGEVKAYVRQMLSDITHLQRLVNDLLELTRLQNAGFQIDKTLLNLDDVLTEAVRAMRRVSEPRHISIVYTNAVGPFLVYGDYGRLRQMFTVVLDNAVKFSAAGGSVEVEVTETPEGCAVTLTDHGQGIEPQELDHIFDRFFSKRGTQNVAGSGLGLSIAREIAARHDVEVRCESTPGVRTCFSFHFLRTRFPDGPTATDAPSF